jgi:uncharacterized membrane protein
MLLTFVAAALGWLPAASAAVLDAQSMCVRLALPMLLFGANLREVASRASDLLPAFLLATLGTTLGALCGSFLLRGPLLAACGADAAKVVCSLAAMNIGGGPNFVAVSAALGLSAGPAATALAADSMMALLYFPAVNYLGRTTTVEEIENAAEGGDEVRGGAEVVAVEEQAAEGGGDRIGHATTALALALAAVALSRSLAPAGFDMPLSSLLTVAAATLAPRILGPLIGVGGELGEVLLYLFFATAGWAGGGLRALATTAPILIGFMLLLHAVHATVIAGVGRTLAAGPPPLRRFFRTPLLLIGSNANIGGTATAPVLALGSGWPSLVTPALLVGNVGYAIATPICHLLHAFLSRGVLLMPP